MARPRSENPNVCSIPLTLPLDIYQWLKQGAADRNCSITARTREVVLTVFHAENIRERVREDKRSNGKGKGK